MKRMNIKNKIVHITFGVLMSLILMAGCSSESDQDTLSNAQDGTRTVETPMGEIEVPMNPQRIVVNWYIGDMYTLDLNVVGYNAWAHETMPFYEEMINTTSIENWEQEDVMALEPDLIITYSEDDYTTFNSIAPVLVVLEDGKTPEERLRIIAEATGRQEEAEEAISEFESTIADLKTKVEQSDLADKTFSVNQDWGSASYGVYYETGSRGGSLIYNYLGLSMPENLVNLIDESGEGRGGLSYEVAADYYGDYIVWFRPDNGEEGPSEYEQLPIWDSLEQVQDGHVMTISGDMMGLFYYDDMLSMIGQVNYLADKFDEVMN